MKSLKHALLMHEPFLPMHIGLWIRLRYFERYFFRAIGSARVRTILDAGCGRGRYAALVAARLPEAIVTGYDLVPHEEWRSIKKHNLHFVAKDLQTMTESDAFDVVISVDSLEHIPNNESVLTSFYQALRPGGVLYLAIPNESEEWHFFPQKWFSRFHEWEEHEHIGEQRTLIALKNLISQRGFEIMVARHTFTFLGALAWELEFLLHHHMPKLRIIAMPFLKMLGIFDLYFPIGKGNNLVIARKPLLHSLEDTE